MISISPVSAPPNFLLPSFPYEFTYFCLSVENNGNSKDNVK